MVGSDDGLCLMADIGITDVEYSCCITMELDMKSPSLVLTQLLPVHCTF
jgi:hypothetical protein